MILVLLGTQDKEFKRLLKEVQNCIDNKLITERVVVQGGCTKFSSNDMEIFELIPMSKFSDLINEAKLIITHGGVGSIIQALKLNKRVIAAPRLKKYFEHTNDHQIEIIEAFSKEDYILGLFENDSLENILKNLGNFNPKPFTSNNDEFKKLVITQIGE